MGIDPITHKPKTHACGFSQSKDLANLNHMAQWESARLQAEARLVRKSATAPPPSPLPPPPMLVPPSLNVLKQWQETWTKPEKNISTATINSIFEGYDGSLELSTCTLIPHVGETTTTIYAKNTKSTGECTVGNPSNNNHLQDELEAIVGNAVELQDITNPSENPAFIGDSLRFPGLLNEFTDFPHGIDCGNAPDSDNGDGLEGFLEENGPNYWLNDTTFPMNLHPFY